MKSLEIKIFTFCVLTAIFSIFSQEITAQSYSYLDGSIKTEYWGDPQGMLTGTNRISLKGAALILDKYEPSIGKTPQIRKLALSVIDQVVHQKNAAYFAPLQQFIENRTERAIREIKTATVEEGAGIWKFYNDGFVVKTP